MKIKALVGGALGSASAYRRPKGFTPIASDSRRRRLPARNSTGYQAKKRAHKAKMRAQAS